MIVRNFKLYFQIRLIAAMCRSISLSIRVYKSICGSLTFHNFFFLQQYLGTYNPVHIFIYEICAKDVWVFNISFRFFFQLCCVFASTRGQIEKEIEWKCCFSLFISIKNNLDIWWKFISEFRCCFQIQLGFYCSCCFVHACNFRHRDTFFITLYMIFQNNIEYE